MTPHGPGGPSGPGSADDEGIGSHRDTGETGFADPTRRTYLALERTLLAWWRTALGTLAVAVAIGSILPKLAHLARGGNCLGAVLGTRIGAVSPHPGPGLAWREKAVANGEQVDQEWGRAAVLGIRQRRDLSPQTWH